MIKQSDIIRQEEEHCDTLVIELKPTADVAVDIDRYHKDTYILHEDDDSATISLNLADKSFTI